MTEIFLNLLIKAASLFKVLMPLAIRASKNYLDGEYERTLSLDKGPLQAEKLHHLALKRQKLHPPKEFYEVVIKIAPDISLKANLCQQYCGDIYYGVGFEQSELSLVEKFVLKDEVFFDVGANIGVYTLLASKLVGEGGSVHSFEPLPDVYGILSANVEAPQYKNVKTNQVAVGEQNGEAQIFINAQNALSSLGKTNRGVFLHSRTVSILTLDSYVVSAGISKIDFLKIDVEGFEGHVLRGAAKLLDASPDLIVMSELAKKNFAPLGFSIDETLNWMRARGFEIWMVGDHSLELHPTFSIKNEYPFQNFLFIRPSNPKYHLVKKYSVSS